MSNITNIFWKIVDSNDLYISELEAKRILKSGIRDKFPDKKNYKLTISILYDNISNDIAYTFTIEQAEQIFENGNGFPQKIPLDKKDAIHKIIKALVEKKRRTFFVFTV